MTPFANSNGSLNKERRVRKTEITNKTWTSTHMTSPLCAQFMQAAVNVQLTHCSWREWLIQTAPVSSSKEAALTPPKMHYAPLCSRSDLTHTQTLQAATDLTSQWNCGYRPAPGGNMNGTRSNPQASEKPMPSCFLRLHNQSDYFSGEKSSLEENYLWYLNENYRMILKWTCPGQQPYCGWSPCACICAKVQALSPSLFNFSVLL
jgi:hypothetical protein